MVLRDEEGRGVASVRPPTRERRSPALPSGRGVSLRRLPGPARPSAATAWSTKLRGLRFPPSCVPAVAGPRRPQLPLSLSLPPFASSRLFPPWEPHFSPLASRAFTQVSSRVLRAAASSPSRWSARAGRVNAETASRLGVSEF